MKKSLALIFCSLYFSSCVTTASWTKKEYHPQRGGVVSYSTSFGLFDLFSDTRQSRKADAQLKMQEFCEDKKPKVLSQDNEKEMVGSTTNYNTSTSLGFSHGSATTSNEFDHITHIKFVCE